MKIKLEDYIKKLENENKKDKMAEYALRMAASTISLEGSRMGYLD